MSEEAQGAAPAQVEQPAEPTTAQEHVAAEPTDDASAQPTEPAKPVVPPGLQKRIDQLTREKYEAKREAEALREMVMRGQQPREPEPQAQVMQKPTREQFDYDEDRYLEALADFKVAQTLTARQQEQERQRQAVERQRMQADYQQRVNQALTVGLAKYPDFDDVVMNNDTLPITPQMADAMSLSDIGADIAYHLGKHPEEAAKIAALPPLKQAMEIARLETKLQTPPPKKLPSAPAPIDPVGARGAVETDPNKMTADEWRRWREDQLRNKR